MADGPQLLTYEITWSDNEREMIQAHGIDYTAKGSPQQMSEATGYGHIRFWVGNRVILSAREGNLISVRYIPTTVLGEDKADVKGQEKED